MSHNILFGGLHQKSVREIGLCYVPLGTINQPMTWVQHVPLKSVEVIASVVHAVAQVQVTQVYANVESQPIEVVYYFPIDSNGAVTHFEAEINERNIKGVVKTNEEAKSEYFEATENNQTACLGAENKPDVFQIRVGCLQPGTEAKIIIGYTTEVKNERGSSMMRFFIPTTIAPRYVPDRFRMDLKLQELNSLPFSVNSPAMLSIKVHLFLQDGIQSIESPSHKIVVSDAVPVPEKAGWTKKSVELLGKATDMDRDFVLQITPTGVHKPKVYVEKRGNSMALMTYLIPSFKFDDHPVELIFVLDRSGSMQGQSLYLAKRALQIFLHSLPVGCYFNIVGFGSRFDPLFSQSRAYNELNLQNALSYAQMMEANLGGTEMLGLLQTIYSAPKIPGYSRQVFVITDGEIANTEEVIGLTKCSANESRVFALGIGDAASHHLVEGLAAAGRGTSAFVAYGEAIDRKVLEQLKDAFQPSLQDVAVNWMGVEIPTPAKPQTIPVNKEKTLLGYGKPLIEIKAKTNTTDTRENELPKKSFHQSPRKIQPLFDGSQAIAFGVFENFGNEMPESVMITADSPDGPLSVSVDISEENDVGETEWLHKLASIKIIRDLELEVAALRFSNLSLWERERQEEKYKADIVKIAIKDGLTSKYTSFIAVDTCEDGSNFRYTRMPTRVVPSQIPQGQHGAAPRFGETNFFQSGFPQPANTTFFSTNNLINSASNSNLSGFGRFGLSPGSHTAAFGSAPKISLFGSSNNAPSSTFGIPTSASSHNTLFGGTPVANPFGNVLSFGIPRKTETSPGATSLSSNVVHSTLSQSTPLGINCNTTSPAGPTAVGGFTFGGTSSATSDTQRKSLFGSSSSQSSPSVSQPSATSLTPFFSGKSSTVQLQESISASPTTTTGLGQQSTQFNFSAPAAGGVSKQPSKLFSTNTNTVNLGVVVDGTLQLIKDSQRFGVLDSTSSDVDGDDTEDRTTVRRGFQFGNGNVNNNSSNNFLSPSTSIFTNVSFANTSHGLDGETDKNSNRTNDALYDIISFKWYSFDGSFKWDNDLILILGLDIISTKRIAESNGWSLRPWATALAITFLKEKLPEQKDTWELMASKSRKWLTDNYGDLAPIFFEAATKLFKPE